MEITININNLNYSINGYQWYPLPYGNLMVSNARIFGRALSTSGGGWKWNLPEKCIVGYGAYSPYVEFFFSGNLNIASKEDDLYTYFLRSNDRRNRWLHFEGRFKASQLYKLENILRNLNLTDWQLNARQGHLSIWSVRPNMRLYDILNLPSAQIVGRRKILNHQFFGNCGIFHIGNFSFVIFVRDTTYVVSPDHLDRPIVLGNGVYLASHPAPSVNGVD